MPAMEPVVWAALAVWAVRVPQVEWRQAADLALMPMAEAPVPMVAVLAEPVAA